MPDYKVLTKWKSWARGTAVFCVEAENEVVAREIYLSGEGTGIAVKSGINHDIIEIIQEKPNQANSADTKSRAAD